MNFVFQAKPAIEAVVQEVDDTLQLLQSQVESRMMFCRRLIFRLWTVCLRAAQLRRAIVSVAVWDGEHDTFQNRYVYCVVYQKANIWTSLMGSVGEKVTLVLPWKDVSMYGDKERRRSPTSEGPVESRAAGLLTVLSKMPTLALVTLLYTFLLQESLADLVVAKRWYGNRDNFTVVMQDTPLISDLPSASVS